jgi:hypothetical protein
MVNGTKGQVMETRTTERLTNSGRQRCTLTAWFVDLYIE